MLLGSSNLEVLFRDDDKVLAVNSTSEIVQTVARLLDGVDASDNNIDPVIGLSASTAYRSPEHKIMFSTTRYNDGMGTCVSRPTQWSA